MSSLEYTYWQAWAGIQAKLDEIQYADLKHPKDRRHALHLLREMHRRSSLSKAEK